MRQNNYKIYGIYISIHLCYLICGHIYRISCVVEEIETTCNKTITSYYNNGFIICYLHIWFRILYEIIPIPSKLLLCVSNIKCKYIHVTVATSAIWYLSLLSLIDLMSNNSVSQIPGTEIVPYKYCNSHQCTSKSQLPEKPPNYSLSIDVELDGLTVNASIQTPS